MVCSTADTGSGNKLALYFAWGIARKGTFGSRYFLRTVGYLELVRNVGQWSVAPPTLVQVTNSHFTLLGGSREKERLEAATSKKAVREILSDYSNQLFPRDVSFFPSTVSLEATRPEVIRLSNRTGLQVSF